MDQPGRHNILHIIEYNWTKLAVCWQTWLFSIQQVFIIIYSSSSLHCSVFSQSLSSQLDAMFMIKCWVFKAWEIFSWWWGTMTRPGGPWCQAVWSVSGSVESVRQCVWCVPYQGHRCSCRSVSAVSRYPPVPPRNHPCCCRTCRYTSHCVCVNSSKL